MNRLASCLVISLGCVFLFHIQLHASLSKSVAFNPCNAPINTPVLKSPSNGSSFQVPGATVYWYQEWNSTFYKLKVATDPQMNNIVFADDSVTGLSRIIPNLNYNSTYYWNLQAGNSQQLSKVTETWSFTTMPDNPKAVTTHPRLWITQNDLPRLRSWAVQSNPVFVAMQIALIEAIDVYNTKFFPGGVPNPNWPDLGNITWSGYVSEQYAEFFAFWSLIDPIVTNRPIQAKRARNLIMYAIDLALLGSAKDQPYRDPLFMTYDRSRVYGEAYGLTVDWIYNAKDENNQNILSDADKSKIRKVFMRWCEEQLDAYNHPEPIGIINDKILLDNKIQLRWVYNNYYSGHARNMTMMALCLDEQDDPPLDPSLHFTAFKNSLRSYLYNATGAWLYQQYAMYGETDEVISDFGLPSNFSGLGLGNGGLSVEGALYGESMAFVAGGLLALKTAGWADEMIVGKQAKLIGNIYWTKLMDGLFHSVTPGPKVFPEATYYGPIYQAACYGDLLRTWIDAGYIGVSGCIGILEEKNKNQKQVDKARWFSRNVIEGGMPRLTDRIVRIWPGSNATNAILYFMLLDPNGSNPPDPRPEIPTVFYDPAFQRLLSRTDWTPNANWFNWHCHWTTINHQSGDGNQFEFFRKGEWLIKERSGYANDLKGYTSEFHNTLALQNDVPPNMYWFEGVTSAKGGQWTNGTNVGDPIAVTSLYPEFDYVTGDATNLYNRQGATDILYAVRSMLWLKPDHIIVYDRARTKTANRFKRFHLQVTAPVTISGNEAHLHTPGGQKLYLSNLLPESAVITSDTSENFNMVAYLEPTTDQINIEDPSNPSNIRFLNVLQGADGSVAKDSVLRIQSNAGTNFDGAVVNHTAVLFANEWNAVFDFTKYTIPNSASLQIVTGVPANSGFDVSLMADGSQYEVTIRRGSQLKSDSAGVLIIKTLNVADVDLIKESEPNLFFEISPNPFTNKTNLKYELKESSLISLDILDLNGKVIYKILQSKTQNAGQHEQIFNNDALASGVYICRLKCNAQAQCLRIVVD